MRPIVRSLAVTGLAALTVFLALPAATAEARTGKPSRTSSTVGYDVSYPQCGSSLPSGQAFGIVGVNGGLATKPNPCLSSQLQWAWRSSGAVAAQPKVQLYVNTANPGEIKDQVTTWPTDGGGAGYGACDGSNSLACSWQYGWDRARNDVEAVFVPAAAAAAVSADPGGYTWWLDVETTNTWQSGSAEALARNRATLEGMTEYLTSLGASVGIYSTNYQWGQIVGTVPADSSLAGRDSWLAGATSLSGATANCARPALVPAGQVTLAQYVVRGLDRDTSCR